MIIISLFVVTCVFGVFGLPSHSATKEAEKQDKAWRKEIKAIKAVEDFLQGGSSSPAAVAAAAPAAAAAAVAAAVAAKAPAAAAAAAAPAAADWIKQLKSWEMEIERVKKNEEFLARF